MFIVTDGIVLKRVKVSDYDKILTVYTRKAGKMSIAVKGSQNPKSKMAAGAHPFVHGEFSIRKSGRMSSASSIDVKDAFYHLREDLDKLTIASYFLELVHIVTVENVINNELFDLLLVFLDQMEKSDNHPTQRLLKVAFELKLMTIIGIRPELEHCVNCGKATTDPKFSVADGGVICEACYEFYPDDYKIGHTLQRLMQYLIVAPVEKILTIEVDAVLIKKVDFINDNFLKYHLERKGFKALTHYDEL